MRDKVFQQYFEQHSAGAFAMAFQMLRCREEARDAIQDACYSMLKLARLPNDSTQFRLLLFKVVRNKAIDKIRANKVRQSEEFNDGSTASEADNPQDSLSHQQQYQHLHQALWQLSEEHRDIILLKDWQGFSYAEIAQILDIESGTVMSRLHRARLTLREKLMMLTGDL